MTETRDHELGAELRALPVPPPESGFFDDLRANLAPAKSRRHLGWLVPVSVAAAVASVVVGASVLHTTVTAKKPDPPATQAPADGRRIAEQMRAAMVQTSGITVTGTWSITRNGREETLAFIAARGLKSGQVSYRVDSGAPSATKLYGDLGAVARTEAGTSHIESGLAFTRPDANGWPEIDRFFMTDVLAVIRAELAAGRVSATEETSFGRPVWKVTLPHVQHNRITGPPSDASIMAFVDRATGAMLRAAEVSNDGSHNSAAYIVEIRDDYVTTAEAVSGGLDRGWLRGSFGQAETAVEYRVPTVNLVPIDLEPAGVAWIVHSQQTTGAEGMNPVTERAVQQVYGRGLAQFTVTTRVQNPDRHSPPDCDGCDHGWQDPLHPGEGYTEHPEDVVLTGGDFAGITAHVVIDARTTPHVWLVKENGLVVTIGGDLTRDELLAAANSLHASTAPVS